MSHGGHTKVFQKARKLYHFLFGCCANVSVFSREIKEPPTYLSSKNKKIRDRVDSRVQLVWRLRVMGSCVYIYLPNVSIR